LYKIEGLGGGEAQGVADPPPPKKKFDPLFWFVTWSFQSFGCSWKICNTNENKNFFTAKLFFYFVVIIDGGTFFVFDCDSTFFLPFSPL
jgi:hypothetical protein